MGRPFGGGPMPSFTMRLLKDYVDKNVLDGANAQDI